MATSIARKRGPAGRSDTAEETDQVRTAGGDLSGDHHTLAGNLYFYGGEVVVGIGSIGAYVPEGYISNYERKNAFGIDDNFIRNKIGVERVTRRCVNEDTSDMCVKAYRNLTEKIDIDIDEIDCIVVCTQNPDDHGIPHTSSIVHRKLGGKEASACFDISIGCSGYVYSLSIIQSFMQAHGMRRGLLFTADPYSKIIDPNDKNTSLLFGDAATVTLLTDFEESWVPRRFLFGTNGEGGSALHNRTGVLEMDGRAVVRFASAAVPTQIRRLLTEVELDLEDIDLIILHQGSRYIVDKLTQRMTLAPEKVPVLLKDHGNTVSSSIPLILERSITMPVRRILLSGFGIGFSWASCLIEKR